MASIDLHLQALDDGDQLAVLLVSPALQGGFTTALPRRLLELQATWRRRYLHHHGGAVEAAVVEDYGERLILALRQWFDQPCWQPLQRALRLQPGLPLRLRLAPALRALEDLPWETLPLDRPLWRLPPLDPPQPVARPRARQARLLLLVGYEEGLELQREVEELQALAQRNRWLLRLLRGADAGADAVRAALEEEPGWDLLIFLGHGAGDPERGGRLQLGDGQWLSGERLEPALRRAADRGLATVLLNCCQGIDLAHRCLAVGVAWVQVFREPVPDGAAARTFRRLLRDLQAGQPFAQACQVASLSLEQPPWGSCRGLLSAYGHPEAPPFRWPRPGQGLQRRELLLLAGSAGAAAAVGLGLGWEGRARQGARVWRMATYLGSRDQRLLVGQAPFRLARRLAQLTDGRFQLKLEDRSALSTSQIFRLVNDGRACQCGYADIYYDKTLLPLIFAKAVPFGLTPREQTAWLSYHPANQGAAEGALQGSEDARRLPFHQSVFGRIVVEGQKLSNLRSFPLTCTGGQMGGWFKRELRDLEDLRGLRMRIPGLGADVLAAFGVQTDIALNAGRTIGPSEIAERLRHNKLDAAEWIGPYDDEALGLERYARFYYTPGWWEPSTTTELMVNRQALEALPLEHRRALEMACADTYTWILREYDLRNMGALERLRRQGVELRRFSPEMLAAFRQETERLLAEQKRQDPERFGYVYDEWRRFRERIRATIAVTQFREPDRPV